MEHTSVLYRIKRWMYRDGRPNRLARALNDLSMLQFSSGVLAPRPWVTLEVAGRRSGRTIRVPVVVTELDGVRYLVSMLGERANWVRNVRAAGGLVTLRHGRRERVLLVEVDVDDRAPVLRRYLRIAPGARPHFPVTRDASPAEFAAIAPSFPVFRVAAAGPAQGRQA
ncbi:nitroreductase/quinone reductase family protein [Asanoa iriomotensis]|nr:nitroreductase/quinone reductase family protein [Asanoa iriomotensis]